MSQVSFKLPLNLLLSLRYNCLMKKSGDLFCRIFHRLKFADYPGTFLHVLCPLRFT